MAFTAIDVKNLREMTGVGMMDCKKALEASDGNMDQAVEWLREKGLAAAQKKAGRVAAEGMAYATVENGVGVLVEVNAESDFVAKNDQFVEFVKGVAAAVADSNPADLDALFASPFPGAGKTVQEVQNDKVLVIGENIKVRRFVRYASGLSVPYVHMGGRIGVLVNLDDWWNSNAAKFKVDDIVPNYDKPYTIIDGKRFGSRYDGDQHLLFYNKDIFAKYNLMPLTTWDEYLKDCKTITEGEKGTGSGVYGCGIMASKIPLILIGTFFSRLATYGGAMFDATGKPTINSPLAVSALEELMKEVPYAQPDPKAIGFDEMLGPWLTGKTGMMEFWTDGGQMTGVIEERMNDNKTAQAPADFQLLGNYPNPFNPGTHISFIVTHATDQIVVVRIYNILGKLIRELTVHVNGAGKYQVYWDGKDSSGNLVTSGNYIYTVIAEQTVLSGKMQLMK
jgi:hypothetical protein